MTPRQRKLHHAKIGELLQPLLGNPNFSAFIDFLREARETAINDACTDSVISSQRASMAAIGEIRTYKAIIDTFDEAVAAAGTDSFCRPVHEVGQGGAE